MVAVAHGKACTYRKNSFLGSAITPKRKYDVKPNQQNGNKKKKKK
jgi:hypothetical protein